MEIYYASTGSIASIFFPFQFFAAGLADSAPRDGVRHPDSKGDVFHPGSVF
jgi:hypothetical protein